MGNNCVKKPDKSNYTDKDEENYARLMIKTNTLQQKKKKKIQTDLEVVIVINGIIYLMIFGKTEENMKEVELLLFRVILTRC